MHIRAKNKSWVWRNCLQSSGTGLCQDIGLGKATKKFFSTEGSQEHSGLHKYKWKKCRTTRTLQRAGCRTKQSNSRRTAWDKIGDQVLDRFWLGSKDPLWRWEKLPSGLHCRVARRKPLLRERHIKACFLVCIKDAHCVTIRKRILRAEETKIDLFSLSSKCHVKEARHHSLPAQYHPTVKHDGTSIKMLGVFQCQGQNGIGWGKTEWSWVQWCS